jgi:hypothetical protein
MCWKHLLTFSTIIIHKQKNIVLDSKEFTLQKGEISRLKYIQIIENK